MKRNPRRNTLEALQAKYPGYEIKLKCPYAYIGYIVTNLSTGDWDEFCNLRDAESVIEGEVITGKRYLLNQGGTAK